MGSVLIHDSRQRAARRILAAFIALAFAAGVLAAPGHVARTGAQGDDQLIVSFEPVVTGISAPVHMAEPPDGSGRMFVVSKLGRIHVVVDGTTLPEPFLDISDIVESRYDEAGMFSIAFHPEFAVNGLFFVSYTGVDRTDSVVRYQVSADGPNRADPGSAQVVLSTPHQNPRYHNGGGIAFGPDGYLYVATGDDTNEDNPQDLMSLHGKLLRIDPATGPVEPGAPAYAIPPDNPFVDREDARPEIWAYGLRNPWRFSFDRETGDLYIADVGQNHWEEINFQPSGSPGGENYGWPVMEGMHCFPPGSECDPTDLTLPVAEYGRDGGCAVIGGYVYRGAQSPTLFGTYLYADICSGNVWGLQRDADGNWSEQLLTTTNFSVTSFAQDQAGELYIVTFQNGAVRRLVATENVPVDDPAFTTTWARTDQPVASGEVARTWIWGPQESRTLRLEPYVDAPGGARTVVYHDKARMEVTDPGGDGSSPWYVTNGLLVVELITGRLQLGDNLFEPLVPANVNVAGDPDDPNGPVYASFAELLDAPPLPFDRPIIQRVDRAGMVTSDDALAGYGVTIAVIDDVTGHTIAAPFWEFMNSEGPVLIDGALQTGPLFPDLVFATGRPITEPYWADVLVDGTPRLVLVQCFERRCLTYTPDNPDGWQVEAGNVGRHYEAWRY